MIERESPKLRRNQTPKTPKKQKSRKEFKSGLAGGGQVVEHDNTKIVKKDQNLSHRETVHVSQYYSTRVSGPQT